MRLICPNCGAQYEVGNDVIPDAGRDVQCSNCGHTWFETPGASEALEAGEAYQPPPAAEPAPAPEPDPAPEPEPDPEPAWQSAPQTEHAPEPEPEPDDTPDPEPVPEPDPSPDPDPDPDPEPQPEYEPAPEPPPTPAQRSTVSPEIARILQEEAEREEAARRSDAGGGLESQPDLGLEAPLDRQDQLAEESRRRMARMRGEAAPAIGAAVTATAGTRRELLPDIEEINSSLRSADDRQTPEEIAEEEVVQEANKRGFRFSFTLIVLIFAVLALLYVFAPQLSGAVPALEPVLDRYVAAVDAGRIWLDQQMQALVGLLEGGEGDAAPATVDEPGIADDGAADATPDADG